ncbi:MAG: MarR family transcriptional regulator [Gemmatimonadales bacterium]
MPRRPRLDSTTRLALSTFVKLRRAVNSLTPRLNPVLQKDFRLTESQFGVLEALLHLGPMPQARLCDKLLVSGSNLTTVIDNLEDRGLVRRVADPEDRRTWQVQLSDRGAELISGAFPPHAARVTALLGTLTAQEQKQLGLLCRKLGLGVRQSGIAG